jgi:hypothetical protein
MIIYSKDMLTSPGKEKFQKGLSHLHQVRNQRGMMIQPVNWWLFDLPG